MNKTGSIQSHSVILNDLDISSLTMDRMVACSAVSNERMWNGNVIASHIQINLGAFTIGSNISASPTVTITRQGQQFILNCDCSQTGLQLCDHQAVVLNAVSRQEELRIFFDEKLRYQKLKIFATDYGLENELDLESFFQIAYIDKKLAISPRQPSLLPITSESLSSIAGLLLPAKETVMPAGKRKETGLSRCIVIKQHKFYKHLLVELYDAPITKEGNLKNPLTFINPQELIWETGDAERIKLFTAISRFQTNINTQKSVLDINSLKAIVTNPLYLPVYYHNSSVSENIIAASLVPVKLSLLKEDIALSVKQEGPFYELSGTLLIGGQTHQLQDLDVVFTFFIMVGGTLYLVKDLRTLNILNLFKRKGSPLLIHQSGYRAFKTQLLEKLEEQTQVSYTYIKPATDQQLEDGGFQKENEKLIYLTDSANYVLIVPVMRYGDIEIPIRTRKQIYAVDGNGKEFLVQRNDKAEIQFTALLTRQHPELAEQLDNDLPDFYLHKKQFLNEEWFLQAFEDWQRSGITVLGFNEITGNKRNPNKVKITVQVISGINWFNAVVDVRFGKKKVPLKQVYKAIRNKSNFVLLDDGTEGLLPADWIEKMTHWFESGDITKEDIIQIKKVNYAAVNEWYNDDMLSIEVQQELEIYGQKLAQFESIPDVPVPADLRATLRPYQRQGLNWLNLLDDLNFGGCLADDMGLGKTVQILAFILVQRRKVAHNTNLLVVPTSLIFNWQAEVKKFAPSIKIHTLHGGERIKNKNGFEDYEIILTTYGTLLSDVQFLKDYVFNYIFLDESQNIKNPESQRYKAARQLQSRNKIAITGTPVENNTFDLYGQLSFACPGLLGSKQYFKDTYSTPIDKFKVSKRATELQRKIQPFILRRTKQQVATELPEKTEVVLHCEMEPAQRKVYDAFETEFREFISATTQEELPRKSMFVLKGLTRLRQICNSPLLLKDEHFQVAASAKIAVLMDQIESKAPQHKILVFSQFVSMLELIKTELEKSEIPFAWLTGATKNRNAVVDAFQNRADIRVFLISLKAGGTGLNLTAADYVYIVDPWWNPAVENQAIDRLYRIGQQKNVIAVRLICPDTVEEKIHQLQESKKGIANELIRSDTSLLQALTKNELLGWLE